MRNEGLLVEFNYWKGSVKAGEFGEIYGRDKKGIKFNRFVESIIELPESSYVKILDVGGGPISPLGTKSDKYNIDIINIDPLAEEYRKLLDENKLDPDKMLIPKKGTVEKLDLIFNKSCFDIVTAFNSLDHSENPILGIEKIIDVTKKDGKIYIWCYQNEGEFENYVGLHQWNFDVVENEVVIKDKENLTKLSYIIKDNAIIEKQWIDLTTIKPTIHFVLKKV